MRSPSSRASSSRGAGARSLRPAVLLLLLLPLLAAASRASTSLALFCDELATAPSDADRTALAVEACAADSACALAYGQVPTPDRALLESLVRANLGTMESAERLARALGCDARPPTIEGAAKRILVAELAVLQAARGTCPAGEALRPTPDGTLACACLDPASCVADDARDPLIYALVAGVVALEAARYAQARAGREAVLRAIGAGERSASALVRIASGN